MSQQKAREGQLRAMKDSLPDLLEEMGERAPECVKRCFREVVVVASAANAKKIAGRPLRPAEITQARRPQ